MDDPFPNRSQSVPPPVELLDLGAPAAQPKRFALLAYLVVTEPSGLQRRDRLVALLWPDLDQEHARTALRKALHALRAALGPDAIRTRGTEEVGIDRDRVHSDVMEFEGALAAGRLMDGLKWYRGDLLDGFFISDAPTFERWLDQERARLRARAATAAWTVADEQE